MLCCSTGTSSCEAVTHVLCVAVGSRECFPLGYVVVPVRVGQALRTWMKRDAGWISWFYGSQHLRIISICLFPLVQPLIFSSHSSSSAASTSNRFLLSAFLTYSPPIRAPILSLLISCLLSITSQIIPSHSPSSLSLIHPPLSSARPSFLHHGQPKPHFQNRGQHHAHRGPFPMHPRHL